MPMIIETIEIPIPVCDSCGKRGYPCTTIRDRATDEVKVVLCFRCDRLGTRG